MLAIEADTARLVRCGCGQALARVSRYGVQAGLYPCDGVRMELESGRALLYCPSCGTRVKLTITTAL